MGSSKKIFLRAKAISMQILCHENAGKLNRLVAFRVTTEMQQNYQCKRILRSVPRLTNLVKWKLRFFGANPVRPRISSRPEPRCCRSVVAGQLGHVAEGQNCHQTDSRLRAFDAALPKHPKFALIRMLQNPGMSFVFRSKPTETASDT